ncbi:MAG: redox-regulated ATPase YchF [Elusimicrobiota bacterium]|jgi:GTP-binding protein YchF|nr:redox-regulated ATPase YchF [Elusimicrobiota bacterium]
MKLGIVGLPNIGKSTLFNAITNAGAEVANYPFCTINPNVGAAPVEDKRLDFLENLYHSKKKIPAIAEFTDIAGLVKGASKGEGLGNQFLSHIRETAAIVHLVRCFEDKDITHVSGAIDPLSDIEIINMELIFADLESIEKKLEKLEKNIRLNDKTILSQRDLAVKLKEHLGLGNPARTLILKDEEAKLLKDFFLITSKPILYVCNIAEKDLGGAENPYQKQVKEIAAKEGAAAMSICAKIEAELSELSVTERSDFLKELGLEESGLNKLVKASYETLGLSTFLTAGEDETRAWTIKKDCLAPQAAGVIHTDFEKGFIRAEVMKFDDLFRLGNEKAVREAGLLKSEGRDYKVQDGDIIEFKFNV